jgi:hypothetical protein
MIDDDDDDDDDDDAGDCDDDDDDDREKCKLFVFIVLPKCPDDARLLAAKLRLKLNR